MTTLSEAARAMGSARSERKAAASRANGKLGGRPRKPSAEQPHDLRQGCACVIPTSAPQPPAVLIVPRPEGQ